MIVRLQRDFVDWIRTQYVLYNEKQKNMVESPYEFMKTLRDIKTMVDADPNHPNVIRVWRLITAFKSYLMEQRIPSESLFRKMTRIGSTAVRRMSAMTKRGSTAVRRISSKVSAISSRIPGSIQKTLRRFYSKRRSNSVSPK